MVTSADISILLKVAELAKRCGLRPSDAETSVYYANDDEDPKHDMGHGHFGLVVCDPPSDPDKHDKYEKFRALLGMDGRYLRVANMEDIEDAVDRALSLAPQARAR